MSLETFSIPIDWLLEDIGVRQAEPRKIIYFLIDSHFSVTNSLNTGITPSRTIS